MYQIFRVRFRNFAKINFYEQEGQNKKQTCGQ